MPKTNEWIQAKFYAGSLNQKLQYEFDFGTLWTNMFSGLPTRQIKFNQLSTKKKKKKKGVGVGTMHTSQKIKPH
jgi:hypothetical protein